MSTTLKALAEAGHEIAIVRDETGFTVTARRGRSNSALAAVTQHVDGNILDLENVAVQVKTKIDAVPQIIPTREELDAEEDRLEAELRSRYPGAQVIRVQIQYSGPQQ